jgi:protoporphyrinogen oxidase
VKTAILGGGLTGITLAQLLHKQGDEVIILEKESSIGGLCRSKYIDGFTFDIGGSHIIFSRDHEILSYMKDMLGSNLEERDRNTKIFYKDKFIKYPFENGLYQLPKEDCFFCIDEFIKTLIRVEKGELPIPTNFREWIYYTFGKGIAESYMIPYNEKIWNYPAEKMSMHWVEDRIPRPPVEDIIRSAIGIETEGYTHQSIFSYPINGGIEKMVQGIAMPVQNFIQTGFNITSIREKNGKFSISNGETVIEADRCFSTIPLHELLPCLEDVPDSIQQSCNSLRYNSIVSVFIGIKGSVPDYSWLYIPQKELGYFNRISFPSNYSTKVAPKDHSSILIEITYNEGDEISEMSDDEIIHHVIDGLIKMNVLENPDDIVLSDLEHQKYAYVVYDLDYQKNISILKSFVADRNITLIGRFAEFEYLNMDGCIRRVFDIAGGSS